jgi:hypothetical protein
VLPRGREVGAEIGGKVELGCIVMGEYKAARGEVVSVTDEGRGIGSIGFAFLFP